MAAGAVTSFRRSGARAAISLHSVAGRARSPRSIDGSFSRTPTCCSTTWDRIWRTSASGSPAPPTSGRSRCSGSGTSSISSTTVGRPLSIRRSSCTVAKAPGRAAKRRIGYLPENNPLYPDMLVCDYLTFIADLRELDGSARDRAIDEAVTATSVETVFYRPIGELSKGFRQRVGLAQAILHRPDLLVLDEPTEGLDPNQRVEIRRLIAAL